MADARRPYGRSEDVAMSVSVSEARRASPQYRFARRGVWVDLDAERLAWCWRWARRFRADALAKGVYDQQATEVGRLGRQVSEDEAISLHAFGVMGEWATAVVLGRAESWEPKVGAFLSESDLGFGVDARTVHVSSYGLWVRKKEKPTHVSVLVLLHEVPELRPTDDDVYRPGRALVVGWYRVGEAREHEEWEQDFRNGRTRAYCVPQDALKSLDELQALMQERVPQPKGPPVSFVHEWEPEELDPADLDVLLDDPLPRLQRQARDENRKRVQAQQRREYLAQRAVEDQEKRQWLADGNDVRQPEAYRGRVYDVPDRDGVHPTAFPPLREGAGAELTEEFIEFQRHNQTRYETHPQYYCVDCKIRYNARDGGRCGPCLGKMIPSVEQGRMPSMTPRRGRTQPDTSQYPL